MPVYVAQTVQKKGPSGAPPFATMASLLALLRHRMLLAAQLLATYVWTGPRATRGVDELERRWRSSSLPRQTPCRGGCLVAPGSLSLTGPCPSVWRPAASLLSRLGWPSRQAPLVGVLCLERQSQQAPLAGASLSSGGRPGKLLLPGPCVLS